jgi:IS30 family transposase
MAGVTSIIVKESLEEIERRLSQASKPIVKERLQLLYWLKQEKAPSISNIAKSIGRHRGTVYQLTRYRLKAKLKVVRPQHYKQDQEQRLAFKKT